jgi:DNA-binding MarR family transcriptional regulator
MSDDLVPLQVAITIHESIGNFARQLRQAPSVGDLSFSEVLTLGRIERMGSVTASELSKSMQVTPQAIGSMLAALEKRGIVKRRADPSHGRRVLLSITRSGKKALQSRRDTLNEEMARVLDNRFTQDEMKKMVAAMELVERLGEFLW